MENTEMSNDAIELRAITEKAKGMTRADHMYEQFIEQAKTAASSGVSEVSLEFYRKAYFIGMYDAMKERGMPLTQDATAYVEDNYNAQSAFVEVLKKHGFTVDIKERSILLINPNEDPMTRMIESDVVVRW